MRFAQCASPVPSGLLAGLVFLFAAFTATAQELTTATESPSATPVPLVTATATPARNVRISFVPPPLDGTISLGIYDFNGRLVRVLHQQAPLDEFTIGADALQTKWDGKDDYGQDLPPGKYHARGFAVGALQVENLSADQAASPPPTISNSISIKLTPNPLVKNDRPNVQLGLGFDDTDSFLKTTDELPLYVISERPGITSVVAAKSGEKSVDVWQDSPAGTEHFRISKLDQMMAFDCGAFDLK
jgi:hypothetical protein